MQSDDVSVRYTIFGGILTQLQFIPEVAIHISIHPIHSRFGSSDSSICPGVTGLVEAGAIPNKGAGGLSLRRSQTCSAGTNHR